MSFAASIRAQMFARKLSSRCMAPYRWPEKPRVEVERKRRSENNKM